MEDIRGEKLAHKVEGHMHKTRVLTNFCCAGSGGEGVMEDKKGNKCAHNVDGNMHKSESTYRLLLCR